MRAHRRSRARRRIVGFAPFFLFVAITACSDTAEPGPIAELAGTWDATSMVVTSKDDPDTGGDIIAMEEYGASFTLTIRSSGRYTAVLTVFEQTRETEGTVEVSESTITFDPDGDDPPRGGTWSLQNGTLVIDGDTSFDFNRDGIPESADLHLELERR